jgi:hypothetical protein
VDLLYSPCPPVAPAAASCHRCTRHRWTDKLLSLHCSKLSSLHEAQVAAEEYLAEIRRLHQAAAATGGDRPQPHQHPSHYHYYYAQVVGL